MTTSNARYVTEHQTVHSLSGLLSSFAALRTVDRDAFHTMLTGASHGLHNVSLDQCLSDCSHATTHLTPRHDLSTNT